MSWTKSTYDGKVCYERGGERVFRTQDIDALEEAERREIERNREKMEWNRIRWEEYERDRIIDDVDMEEPYKSPSTKRWNTIVVITVLCVWLLFFYFATHS